VSAGILWGRQEPQEKPMAEPPDPNAQLYSDCLMLFAVREGHGPRSRIDYERIAIEAIAKARESGRQVGFWQARHRGERRMTFSEPRFTEGPWMAELDYRPGMSLNIQIVSERDPNIRIAVMTSDGSFAAQVKANADLIAAAPNLYAALRRLVIAVYGSEEEAPEWPNGGEYAEALALARGET
jgi:hypothetical protein